MKDNRNTNAKDANKTVEMTNYRVCTKVAAYKSLSTCATPYGSR